MTDFHEIFEKVPDGITLHDPDDGSILETNQQFCEMLGYTREELLSLDFEALHIDEAPYTCDRAKEYIHLAATEGPQTFEWVDETKEGTALPVEVNLRQTTIDGDARILAVVRDVTERKERERDIERYRALVETVGDPMYVLDADGRIQMVNQAMAELGGASHEELIGTHVSEFLGEGDAERGTDLIRELLADSDRNWGTYEIKVEPASGESFPAEVNMGLILDDDGDFRGTAGVLRDLTEHKARERQLERQNARLEEFASIVSHDLRNPLSVASGRLELAREECDSEHLEAVSRAQERMEVLIDDLLSLARTGESISDTRSIDLSELVQTCWRTVETGSAELIIQTEASIEADETRLRQLLENLVRNAVEHGGDDVTVTVGDLENGFFIEDDGAGIPEPAREEIFEAGYSTSSDGTGFGLSIVKQIVDAHGWELSVDDGSDGGARFEITGVKRG